MISLLNVYNGGIYINIEEADNKSELLKFALDNGMIDLSYVQEQIEMNKRKELLKKHPYKIWEGKDGKWYTYLPDEERGRVLKKKKSQEEIENLLISYYKEQSKNPTIKDIFNEWILEKLEYNEISKPTYDRYKIDFNRYFMSDNMFGERRIKTITPDDIERFIKKTIVDQNLTAKSYGNLRILIYGIFKKCKNCVGFSITQVVGDMQISKKIFKKTIKENSFEVFNEEELNRISSYLTAHVDIINLGILLMFSSGMRIGELCTLKSSDIESNIIKVRRTETIYRDEDGKQVYDVKEFPKTEAGVRDIIIPTNDMWILERIYCINPSGEYLFEKNSQRLKALFFRKRLYSVCNQCGIIPKSPHKIRKTYGSILLDNGVDKRFILEQMGHTDIICTENHYHRGRKSIDKKTEIVNDIDEICIEDQNTKSNRTYV